MRFREGNGRDEDGIASINSSPSVGPSPSVGRSSLSHIASSHWAYFPHLHKEQVRQKWRGRKVLGRWGRARPGTGPCPQPPLRNLVRCAQGRGLHHRGVRRGSQSWLRGDLSTAHLTRHSISKQMPDDKEPHPTYYRQHPITINDKLSEYSLFFFTNYYWGERVCPRNGLGWECAGAGRYGWGGNHS